MSLKYYKLKLIAWLYCKLFTNTYSNNTTVHLKGHILYIYIHQDNLDEISMIRVL